MMLALIIFGWLVAAALSVWFFYVSFDEITLGDVVMSLLCGPVGALYGMVYALARKDIVLFRR